MKKSSIALTLSALTLASASFAAKQTKKDPVVMTVGPQKVQLSEFEYLYKKNNDQQASKTSLDDYIEMFVNYKLKVQAAKDAGLDTTASYVSDMEKYTAELAAPYMRSAIVDDSLVNVAYEHMKEMVLVDHILLSPLEKNRTHAAQRALADSIRDALLDGADFAKLAEKYSVDRITAARGGDMGYIVGGVWPYIFEDLAFNTPVGEISKIGESTYGFHIVRVKDRKPNPGSIKTRHILKSVDDQSGLNRDTQKNAIDSILNLARTGSDFRTLASENTDDPSGRKTGGDLPWFTTGQMVSEFNDAAFQLQPGQISDPVLTRFGWHIILCEDRKNVEPLDSIRSAIADRIRSDERSSMSVLRTINDWKAKAGLKTNESAISEGLAIIKDAGSLSAEAIERMKASATPAFRLGKDEISLGDIAESLRPDTEITGKAAESALRFAVENKINELATQQYIASLPQSQPAYRNLLNEYRDGMLLYEISNKEVWDRANADSTGLQKFYEAHIGDYTWDRPHYKGYVIAATTDSLADVALAYFTSSTLPIEQLTNPRNVRKRFGTDVKVERVLAGKGDNPVIDNLAFGAPAKEIKNRWKFHRLYAGRVIDAPEDARDVKGQVSLGFQQQLESEWLERLRKTYRIKIDRKAIRKALE